MSARRFILQLLTLLVVFATLVLLLNQLKPQGLWVVLVSVLGALLGGHLVSWWLRYDDGL